MPATRSEAIILKSIPYRETSVLLDLLTRESGRMRCILKGVRVTPGRVAPLAFTTGSHVEIVLYPKRTASLTLAHAPQLLTSRRPLAGVPLAAWHGALLLVRTFLPERELSPEIFVLLLRTADALAASELPAVVLFSFKMRFVRIMGYGVQLTRCVACGSPEHCVFFSPKRGGLLCRACHPNEPTAVRMPLRVLTLMRHVNRMPMAALPRVRRVPGDLLEEANFRLNTVLQYHTDTQVPWWSHEKSIFPATRARRDAAGG